MSEFRIDEKTINDAVIAAVEAVRGHLLDGDEMVAALAAAAGLAAGMKPDNMGERLASLGVAVTALCRAFNTAVQSDDA